MSPNPHKTTNPQLTVTQLLTALTSALAKYGDVPVTVWLPGSLIDLNRPIGQMPSIAGDSLLIEGNVRSGSALGDG